MMGFLGSFLLPLLLLAASLVGWNLISLVNMLLFFAIQFATPRVGFSSWRVYTIACCAVVFSVLVLITETIFHILWYIKGDKWIVADYGWIKLIGFVSDTSLKFSLANQLKQTVKPRPSAAASKYISMFYW